MAAAATAAARDCPALPLLVGKPALQATLSKLVGKGREGWALIDWADYAAVPITEATATLGQLQRGIAAMGGAWLGGACILGPAGSCACMRGGSAGGAAKCLITRGAPLTLLGGVYKCLGGRPICLLGPKHA